MVCVCTHPVVVRYKSDIATIVSIDILLLVDATTNYNTTVEVFNVLNFVSGCSRVSPHRKMVGLSPFTLGKGGVALAEVRSILSDARFTLGEEERFWAKTGLS